MLTLALFAALLAPAGAWSSLHFLEGDWAAVESGGQPGQASSGGQPGQASSGGFSLHQELQGRVLIRKNRAEYPATKDRAGFVHEDLMVIYPDAKRAVYFDSEGHVIHYTIEANGTSAVFLSEPEASAPRYRLTYRSTAPDAISIRFETAGPGKPFQTYLEAKARRK